MDIYIHDEFPPRNGTVISPENLRPVAGHVSASLGDLVLIWGGYFMDEGHFETFNPPKELLVYHTICDKWFIFMTSGEIPHETTGACAVLVDMTLYIFGGFCDNATDYAHLYALDLRTLIWSHVEPSSPDVPTVRHKLVGWHYKEKLYFFGGFGPYPGVVHPSNNGQLQYLSSSSSRFIQDDSVHYLCSWNNQLISFNLETKKWQVLPLLGDAPSARAAHSAVYVPETAKVVLFGGRLLDRRMNDMHMLDLHSMIWTKLEISNAPCGRSWHTTVPVDPDHMLLFGGLSQDTAPLNDIWLFDIPRRQWTCMKTESPPKPRLWHTAVSVKGSCYIFGGCTTNIFAQPSRKEFANDLMIVRASPLPLFALCLKYINENSQRFEPRQLETQVPAPILEKVRFMCTKSKSVEAPIELLQV